MPCTVEHRAKPGDVLKVQCTTSDQNVRLRGELSIDGVIVEEYSHGQLIQGVTRPFPSECLATFMVDAAFLSDQSSTVMVKSEIGESEEECQLTGSRADFSDDCLIDVRIRSA